VERMDRARRLAGLVWVASGVAFEVTLFLTRGVSAGPITVAICAVMAVLAVLVAAGAPHGLVVAVRWVAAVALALDFAGAVADRFGIFGGPGRPGVSWGSWAAFVDYTQVLLLGVPRPLAVAAAVLATIVEVTLGVLLLSGYQRRWVGKAAAGLLVVYLISMAASGGLDPIATYAVPVLVGGALLISASPAHPSRPGRPSALGSGHQTAAAGGGDVQPRDEPGNTPPRRSGRSFQRVTAALSQQDTSREES
jgi:uncharacterized membrane protein YphA (DoxX/SURF4 family)